MILRFEPNIPLEVKLKYPNGKHVNGQFGEQVLYSLTDGNIIYVPLIVEKQIQELGVKAGQSVRLCKVKDEKHTEWQVSRPEPKPNGTAAPAVSLLEKTILEEYAIQDAEGRVPPTRLAHALCTALEAAKQAEAYSEKIGHPVRFDKDDVRLMAQTLVINASRERAA